MVHCCKSCDGTLTRAHSVSSKRKMSWKSKLQNGIMSRSGQDSQQGGRSTAEKQSTTVRFTNVFKFDGVESETEGEELMMLRRLHAKFPVIFTILNTDLSSCIINHTQDCLQTADRCSCTSICRGQACELRVCFLLQRVRQLTLANMCLYIKTITLSRGDRRIFGYVQAEVKRCQEFDGTTTQSFKVYHDLKINRQNKPGPARILLPAVRFSCFRVLCVFL